MNALVTGGAGFIGSHLSERLLAQGARVRAVDAFTDFYPRRLKERNLENLRGRDNYELIDGDLRDLDLARHLDGITHVFHLAAQAGVRRSWGRSSRYTGLNIEATQRLLEACVKTPIERFVYASSSSVYGDDVEIPIVETALPQPVSLRRDEARRRAALPPISSTSACRASRCAISRFTVRASDRTWGSTASLPRF
jgi:UDP-glucose 4-epimerase